jgi:hypothetical protein
MGRVGVPITASPAPRAWLNPLEDGGAEAPLSAAPEDHHLRVRGGVRLGDSPGLVGRVVVHDPHLEGAVGQRDLLEERDHVVALVISGDDQRNDRRPPRPAGDDGHCGPTHRDPP